MKPHEYNDLSGPDDIIRMLDGYRWREEKRERDNLAELQLLRHIAVVTHNANSKKGKGFKKPSDLMELPGDKIMEQHRLKKLKSAKQRLIDRVNRRN